MSAVADVRHTYARLADLVQTWQTCGPTDPRLGADASALLTFEARLLDNGRMDDWLDRWAEAGVLWVPIDPNADPATDQSFYLDDVRRLRERIAWARTPSAWSQQRPLSTVRVVSNVEAIAHDDGTLDVRSSLVLWEQRGSARQPWAGHQLHRFSAPDLVGSRLIEAKVLCIPALLGAAPHPGALL